jgi:hypothetical protein
MSDNVSFDEETSYAPPTPAASQQTGSKGIAGLVQKLTKSNDPKQTNTVMIGVIVICVIVMALVWLT